MMKDIAGRIINGEVFRAAVSPGNMVVDEVNETVSHREQEKKTDGDSVVICSLARVNGYQFVVQLENFSAKQATILVHQLPTNVI